MAEELRYRKGEDTALDQDYLEAAPFGKIRVGKSNLYWKSFLKQSYLPFTSIVRIYRRLEEVKGKTGCCSNDFSIHKLMVETGDGEMTEILIGEGLYRGEPEHLMEYLKENHPEIRYRKEKE